MKLTAALFGLVAAQHSTADVHEDIHIDGLQSFEGDGAGVKDQDYEIHANNIRADGQSGSNRNQITRVPTPQPGSSNTTFNQQHNGIVSTSEIVCTTHYTEEVRARFGNYDYASSIGAPNCPTDTAMTDFQLEGDQSNGKWPAYKYRYKCCSISSESTTTPAPRCFYDEKNGNGASPRMLATTGRQDFTGRHWLKGNDPTPVVDCSANGVVKSWDINRCAYDRPENHYEGDGMQYDYTCADGATGECETLTTDCSYIANTHPDDQHTGFLMPHDVKCSQPNSFLTKFGMKFCSDTSFQYEYQCCQGTGPDFGNMCDDGNGFKKPVGWVGAGPGNQFCNIWRCEAGEGTSFSRGTFRKQVRTCSVEAHGDSFCSHTSCEFKTNSHTGDAKVINVRTDHRETVGGYHICGFARHAKQGGYQDNEAGAHLNTDNKGGDLARPACDCICFGLNSDAVDAYANAVVPAALRRNALRRQDEVGFVRNLNEISSLVDMSQAPNRVVENDSHDATTDANSFDAARNSNNLYSKHDSNNAEANYPGAHTQVASRAHSAPTGLANTVTETLSTAQTTTYNENDHSYAGQTVAHVHIDT